MPPKKESRHTKNITQYFRQSLIDGERVCPTDNEILPALETNKTLNTKTSHKGEIVAVNINCWPSGSITQNEADIIFKKIDIKRIEQKKKPPDYIEVVLFPRVDSLKSVGGKRNTYKRKIFLPIVVFMKLNRGGGLSTSDTPPWIPRIWLSPNVGQNQSIGDLSAYDDFVSGNPYEAVATWQELLEYCNGLLEAVAEKSLQAETIHEDYTRVNQAILLVSPPIVGAKEKIISVLDKIIDGKKPSQLYNNFILQSETTITPMLEGEQWAKLKHQHVGQMTDEFSLSKNQRNALHHFMSDEKEGELLAINGPPGTGKTTFLRTIVANCWVNAALNGKEPPVIVAASNNNQAVTNILEDFARVEEKELEESLQGRWLPTIASYGLYCPAGYLANDNCHFPYHGDKDQGIMAELQSPEYLKKAEIEFLKSASVWANKDITKISTAKKQLHAALRDTVSDIQRGLDSYDSYCAVSDVVFSLYDSEEKVESVIVGLVACNEQMKKEYFDCKHILEDFEQLLDERPWWAVLFSWFPSVKKANQRKNTRFLRLNNIDGTAIDDDSTEELIKQTIIDSEINYSDIKNKLKNLKHDYNQFKKAKKIFYEWFDLYKPNELLTIKIEQQVDEVCDRVLRFKAFKLATHYWEAAWLIETRKFIDDKDDDKKSPIKLKRKWRRFAKLTPCFVSTFYMVPTFFTAFEMRDGNWEDIPLFNYIDLLIVDEAGQVVPEVSSATFALAKKSVIVGDVDQIEPVWNIPASIDKANLETFNLLDGDETYEDYWLNSGHLASAGNIMRIAQRQCRYHQFTQLSRGLYLTEHRRCYDPIIEYCNDLVYKGVLEAKRGEPVTELPWPQMGFYHIDGGSQTFGTSRYNVGQVNSIVTWLLSNRNSITNYARDKIKNGDALSSDKLFAKAVAVVTPFSYQARQIERAIRKRGLPNITVGTVHKLQGAERLIILFSSVYGDGDQAIGKFYDRGHNMLNVAVSRAKDSFITFGHRDVFGKGNSTAPSGKLMCRLDEVTTESEEALLF